MDPATIGLLISIAPTVLDILFGHGKNAIKQETFPKKMYGYGYGLEGYGYRYPPLPDQFAGVPIQTKYGIVVKPVRIPTKKWAAAYFLNKKAVENNPWVIFMRKKMDALRDEYYKEQGKAAPAKVQRTRHKLMAEAIKRIPELAALEGLSIDDLIKAYYEGTVPPRRKPKEKLQVLELPVAKK
jgi:hypothetical protein